MHEIKWDGYRVSAYVADGKATIRTRNGHDWTARFPAIARAAAALKVRSAVLDGEAVILDERGRSSFAELRADIDRHGSQRAVLYAFNLLFLNGEALGNDRWRSADLRLAASSGRARPFFSARITADVAPILCASRASTTSKASCRSGSTAPIIFGRSRDWLKTKCVTTNSFVIIGYQPSSGAVRTPLANIKIATFDGKRLRYAGAIGTGFSEAVAEALRARLNGIKTGLKAGGAVWVTLGLCAPGRVPRRNDGLRTTACQLQGIGGVGT